MSNFSKKIDDVGVIEPHDTFLNRIIVALFIENLRYYLKMPGMWSLKFCFSHDEW